MSLSSTLLENELSPNAMNITTKATNTTLTDAINSAIEEKLKTIESFLKPEDKVHVELEEDTHHKSGLFSRAEIQISPHGYYAEATGNDFYEALDLVIPKIKQQMTKTKDKRLGLRRRFGNIFKRSEE
jgi:ribosomal subunit interface protein